MEGRWGGEGGAQRSSPPFTFCFELYCCCCCWFAFICSWPDRQYFWAPVPGGGTYWLPCVLPRVFELERLPLERGRAVIWWCGVGWVCYEVFVVGMVEESAK